MSFLGERQWDVTVSDKSILLNSGVIDIITNHYAFAAIKDDGNVVTWGMNEAGADEDFANKHKFV